MRRALEEEGHAVDVARDGPEGVWLATENPYGAIVLDVMLPGFDGFEVCRRCVPAEVWAPGVDADRPRRNRRSRPWTRCRSRRLPCEALQSAGARRASAGIGTSAIDRARPVLLERR